MTVAEMVGRLWVRLAARAIQLVLLAAVLAVTLIGLVGTSASVVAVETVQGSSGAINVSGSLRRLAHRAASVAVAGALGGAIGRAELLEAVGQFDASLADPALLRLLEREPGGVFAAIFRGVQAGWHERLKPRLLGAPDSPASSGWYEALLDDVDAYVAQIDTLVAVLEHDAEDRIEQLRTTLALTLVLTLAVMVSALFLVHRRVFVPLADLWNSAARIARGDFEARSRHTGRDELGRVGEAFNSMAGQLSSAYRDLERRVEEKTADLTRSNRSLELLYHVILRLYHAPASPETYSDTLREIEQTLGLEGSFVCVEPRHGGAANVLSSTLGDCVDRRMSEEECACSPGRDSPWHYQREGGQDVLMVPLRDAEHLYGMLRLALPPGRRLQAWQRALLEAVSRHMGIALGLSLQADRERLLALQEERSIIARELHDSLAQSLSYMKIQVSLLTSALAGDGHADEAPEILADIKEGINLAYRQLRELLSTFRLRMEGDFARLLTSTVEEFSGRSAVPIEFDLRLGGCHLNPNQEIHLLHIVREALSNASRHAKASRIRVDLSCRHAGEVNLVVEDDGRGIEVSGAGQPHHYGLTIMAERARGLGGVFEVRLRPGGGTVVSVSFNPLAGPSARPSTIAAEPR